MGRTLALRPLLMSICAHGRGAFQALLATTLLSGCSALYISKAYQPSWYTPWSVHADGPYRFTRNIGTSQYRIRSIHTKDIALMGPVLLPIIPMIITRHGGRVYFELNFRTNDTVGAMIPPTIRLYDPSSKVRLDPAEVGPLNFDTIKRLKLYHLEFTYDKEFARDLTYFYTFSHPGRSRALHFEITYVNTTDTITDTLIYDLKKRTRYVPLLIPQPS